MVGSQVLVACSIKNTLLGHALRSNETASASEPASKQSSLIAGSGLAARQSEWGAAARRPHRHAPGAVPNASPNATETHRTCLSSRVGGLALHAVPAQMPGRVGGASSIKQRSITENKA